MQNFRTEVDIQPASERIDHTKNIFLIGSCFSENIGRKLSEFKFPVISNPFGVLYNPISVLNGLNLIIDQKTFSERDLDFFNHKWFSFFHHTSFSNENKSTCLQNINQGIQQSSDFFNNLDFLFITFGAARVYIYNKTGKVVSNCHKIPAKEFEHKLLSVDEIVRSYSSLLNTLFEKKPDLKVIFSVSPIRHWKDGAVGNQLSKSSLFVAINKLMESFKNVSYFPAYEIVMDDLRDYRFYENDMLHPNQTAIDYIWDKFSETFIDNDSRKLFPEIKKIINAYHHKPTNVSSQESKKFALKTVQLIESMTKKHPFLDFLDELNYFTRIIDKK